MISIKSDDELLEELQNQERQPISDDIELLQDNHTNFVNGRPIIMLTEKRFHDLLDIYYLKGKEDSKQELLECVN